MLRLLVRKKSLLFMGLAVLCLIAAHFTSVRPGGRAVQFVEEVFAPLQSGMMYVWNGARSSIGFLWEARHLKRENELLRQQVRDLTWENNRLHEYVYENGRLLKLLKFKEHYAKRFTLLGARVIARSPNNWYSTLTVDRGEFDGVKKDQVVVSDAGVVGRIVSVGPHTAKVLLILDRDGAVGAMVQENRTLGIVEGSKDNLGLLKMVHLPYDADLKRGQVVVTSGLGGVFPRGIPIGKVLKFEDEGSGVDKYAIVKPFVDFDRLEELFIITEIHEIREPVMDGNLSLNTEYTNKKAEDNGSAGLKLSGERAVYENYRKYLDIV